MTPGFILRKVKNEARRDFRRGCAMKTRKGIAVALSALAMVAWGPGRPLAQAPAHDVPKFQVDPTWPKIPNNWQLGQVASVSIDAQDHVWVLQRPATIEPHEKPRAAPPLLE